MYFHKLVVTQYAVLLWTAGNLCAQQMNANNNNNEGSAFFIYQRPEYPRDCEEARNQCSTDTSSAVYLIKPDGYPDMFEVYCDNDNAEAWTVILRRMDGFLDFNRTWDEYKRGFGFLSQEFWIGNEKFSYLTNQKNYELRIDITNPDGSSCYIIYDLFRISDELGKYKITNIGQYSGNAGGCVTWCPNHMKPGNCSCQKSCENPRDCQNTCNELGTCVCPDGLYLNGEDCVPLSECSGCVANTPNSVVIPEGGFYVSPGCSSRADCNNSQLLWDNTYMCGTNEVCEERNNIWQCYSLAADCLDIYNDGFTESGVYTITPTNWPGSSFEVYCNMTDGGGWTVFQRRADGTINFDKTWTNYKEGFGSNDNELWLGNDKLYYLTNQEHCSLRIDFVNLFGSPYYAKYDFFRINNESDNYRLSEVGLYSGTAGDSLTIHKNDELSTRDRDNDGIEGFHYAGDTYDGGYIGAWWYGGIRNAYSNYSALNGDYFHNLIYWASLPGYPLNITFTEMKIRPV